MKTVCSKHEQAYEVGTSCPWCEQPVVAKAIEATAEKQCTQCKSSELSYQQGCVVCQNCWYESGLSTTAKVYSFTHDYITYELPAGKDAGDFAAGADLYLKYSKQLTEALEQYSIKSYIGYIDSYARRLFSEDSYTRRLFSTDVPVSKTEKWSSVATKPNYEKFKVDTETLKDAEGLPSTDQDITKRCKALKYQIQGTASDIVALSFKETVKKNLPAPCADLPYTESCSKQADLVWKWHIPGGESLKYEPITTLRMVKKRGE
jgi:hypothetical protein